MNRDPYRFRATLRRGAKKGECVDLVLRADHGVDVGRLLSHLGERFSVLMIESDDERKPEPAVEAAAPEPQPV